MATLAVAVDQPLVQGRTRGPVPVVVSIPRRTSSTGAVKRQTEVRDPPIETDRLVAAGSIFRLERLGDQTASSTASEQDVAVAAAIAEAEAESGESLLEWDIEVIKASVEGSWRKQNCRQRSAMANQRATAAGPTSSPSTKPTATTMTARMSATACLLQCLTSVPPEVAARVGIVTVGVVAQPSNVRIEQAATRTSFALSGNSNDAYDDDDEIQSQHGEMLEGWTGSEYYFEGGGSRR
ncbi:hypothetical protein CMQ_1648 [Grosmannia clavigera kw1407]|uniref:Uncharacterized protein n=1 Tax=Grosmannia clavigera (strain kw1407 / UAMH 11150) TaxID=655863 RepID=F0XEM4_GROCL|nr:uncharacterized protein CMQ_1648 [Grosmannia clavigera kw1407]EFX04720.1 hypothetical protein CMQ_1648 [Grosmannia clavigera kw1407]